MAKEFVIFHGTELERDDLLTAIKNNCACEFGLGGARVSTCPPHQMLVEDQKVVDRLVFERRINDRLRAEEFKEE